MSDSHDTEERLEFIRSFGRHLVALCVSYRERGSQDSPPRFAAYACTLLNIDGRNFLLTAGHILKELQQALESERIELLNAVLQDNFGAESVHDLPIPFDLRSANMFFIDDDKEGLDFGVIALGPYYVGLLAANKLVALAQLNWERQHTIQFDRYFMLGLPAEYTSSHLDTEGQGSVSATMFGVRRLEAPPADLPTTRYPRFVGELLPNFSLASVSGMSGGPILGFNLTPPVRYWVVALQSTWLRERRLVFGCPLPVLASLMTDWLRQHVSPSE
jgi:hypothetical protein